MVITQQPAPLGQGVLVEHAALLMLTSAPTAHSFGGSGSEGNLCGRGGLRGGVGLRWKASFGVSDTVLQ